MRIPAWFAACSSRFFLSITALVALLAATSVVHARVSVAIDLTNQRMHVESEEGSYDWPISSARSGFYTPGGSFAPTHLELMHYSKKYHMSPMPHAIFFRGGYAIHGTYSTGELGRPASHGCVRLSPANAASLYAMVKAEGARISISGRPPASRPFAIARQERRHTHYAAAYAPTGDQGYADADDDSETRARPSRHRGYDQGDVAGFGYANAPLPYYGHDASYYQVPFSGFDP